MDRLTMKGLVFIEHWSILALCIKNMSCHGGIQGVMSLVHGWRRVELDDCSKHDHGTRHFR